MLANFKITTRHKLILGWTLVLAMVGWNTFRMSRRLADKPYEDFQAFYLAAEAARTGNDPYRAGTEMYIYLPMLAAWMAPLSKLSITQAAWVWYALSLVGTLGSLWLIWNTARHRLGWNTSPGDGILALGITLLIWQTQCRWEFEQGQTDWLTLAALSIALAALDRFPVVVGLALGFAINIKYLPIVMVAYLVLRQRWMSVLWSAVGTLFWALAPALVYGWQRNLILLSQGLAGLAKLVGIEVAGQAGYVMPLTYDRSITLPSLWGRVAETIGQGMAFITGMTTLSALVVAGIGWLIYRVHGARLFVQRGGVQEEKPPITGWALFEYCFAMLLMIVFSPQAQMRHFFLLLPLVLTAAGLVVLGSTLQIRILAFAGLIVGVLGSIGADIFTLFGMREVWKYISGASISTLILGYLTLVAGLQEIRQRFHVEAMKEGPPKNNSITLLAA